MNTYRVYFHHNQDFVFRSVISASSFSHANEVVNQRIDNGELFTIESKDNRSFAIIKENLSFIEFELLKLSTNIDSLLKELDNLSSSDLTNVFAGIKNNYLSVAFKNNTDILKNSYSSYFKENVLDSILKESIDISPLDEDIEQATSFIIQYISRFKK